jgi:hypothetical protein
MYLILYFRFYSIFRGVGKWLTIELREGRSEDEIQTGRLVKGAVISGSSRQVRLILIIHMRLELRS